MVQPLFKYLKVDGYDNFYTNIGNTKGPDILAENGDSRLLIEVKGDSSAILVDWHTLLGQILDRMTDETMAYAIAVSQKYERLVSRFPSHRKGKLNLTIYIVKDNGEVLKS
ncbi:hypothetical protein ACFLYF_01265 [Chloroflexota bacterium]